MHLLDLLLLVVVAAAAYYAGYQKGRASVRGSPGEPEESPLPGPRMDHLPGPSRAPERPAPPPAAAGETHGASPGADRTTGPPRRSSPPPPAAAGLMDKGTPGTGSGGKDVR
jgi:hypothetical protein